MLERHPLETKLGVQVTSKSPEEMGKAVTILNDYPFETIDINMGCPVKKVVKTGCGSAILKDPEKVYQTTKIAVDSTDIPVSVKIRLGFCHESKNYMEVADAIQQAGGKWLTIHGRTRADNYSVPVNLAAIRQLKENLRIPVVGNGNLFTAEDCEQMLQQTQVDGLMISRGALGNPWVFNMAKKKGSAPSLSEWHSWVLKHLDWHLAGYENENTAVITMRKHLLWYLKGWPNAKKFRSQLALAATTEEVKSHLQQFCNQVENKDQPRAQEASENAFFDPKWDMDRKLDRDAYEHPVAEEQSELDLLTC